jgi:hypothetical protein
MACLNRTGIPLDEISCSKGLKKFHNTEIYDSAEKYLFGLSPPGNVSQIALYWSMFLPFLTSPIASDH